MSEKIGLGPGTLLTISALGEVSLKILGGGPRVWFILQTTFRKEVETLVNLDGN